MTEHRAKHRTGVILMAFILSITCRNAGAGGVLGRLFTTLEERELLDDFRLLPPVNFGQPQSVETHETAKNNPVSETFTVNGLVHRASGRSTIWINNTRILLDSTNILQQPASGNQRGDVLFEIPDHGSFIRLHSLDRHNPDN